MATLVGEDRRRRLRYEQRILLGALGAGAPAVVVALGLLWFGEYSAKVLWTLTLIIVGVWLGGALALRERAMRPLQTLSNLLAALREEDFSLRARGARLDDALGLAMLEANALGETLRSQRLGALEASALLRTVMAEIDVAIFAFDETGRLRLVNREGERLLGAAAERLLGRDATELRLDEFLRGDARRTVTLAFAGGQGRWELRRRPFRQGGISHELVVLADLSRTLREEERQAWQRLVRVLSHEINNSLAPIKSIAGSLRDILVRRVGGRASPAADGARDEDVEDFSSGLAVIAGRSEALSRFVASYARLTRLPPPRLAPLDVSDWVRRVVELETRLEVAVEAGPPFSILADGDQLDQLLINIVHNAVDASLETGGGVRVRWMRENGGVAVLVEDEGPGLHDTANLFVPFFTTKPNGSGIGLALSRQIAEAHGGSLALANRAGSRGCVARLELPATATATATATRGGVMRRALLGTLVALLGVSMLTRRATAQDATVACRDVEGGAGAAALRLATFDTAWHRIHVTHFDTTFNGVDWSALRTELRPRAAASRCTTELRAVLTDMLRRLDQSHFALVPRESAGELEPAERADADRPGTLGFELRVVSDSLVVWRVAPAGPAAAAGVRTGWVLLAADSIELEPLRRRIPTELPQRQRLVRGAAAVADALEGAVGESARLLFVDGTGRIVEATVRRGPAEGIPVAFGNLPTFYTSFEPADADGGRIGVVRFNAWMPPMMPALDSAVERFRGRDGIVLDLRGNPGGVAGLMMGASGHFLDERRTLGTMKSRDGELRFNANPRLVNPSGRRVRPFAGPVAVLVDEMTGSTSEAFAAGMQAIGRVHIVGRRTAGAVLPAVMERLPNGDLLYHAIADFVSPDGTRLEGRGVIPDEVVPLTRAALLGGRDPQMDAALAWIRREREAVRRTP